MIGNVFKRRKRNQHPVVVIPRVAIVQALARAESDGNEKAVAAAHRLLEAIDDSPYNYIAI